MKTIKHEFVDLIPKELEDGILYITMRLKTAVHKCVCGCGNKVVTPIIPTGWHLYFDGATVSLTPSIGSWNLECQSHYFITKNKIVHSHKWEKEKIENCRKEEQKELTRFLKKKKKY